MASAVFCLFTYVSTPDSNPDTYYVWWANTLPTTPSPGPFYTPFFFHLQVLTKQDSTECPNSLRRICRSCVVLRPVFTLRCIWNTVNHTTDRLTARKCLVTQLHWYGKRETLKRTFLNNFDLKLGLQSVAWCSRDTLFWKKLLIGKVQLFSKRMHFGHLDMSITML